MQRFKNLNLYQRFLLLFIIAIAIVSIPIYCKTVKRVGFLYCDHILVPTKENNSTVYSGKINGVQVNFTLSDPDTINFQYGDESYGPYTIIEDPSALPKDSELYDMLIGIEIRKGDEIFFRGGMLPSQDGPLLLVNEDESYYNFSIYLEDSDGNKVDSNGNPIYEHDNNSVEPTAETLLSLYGGPTLRHKGNWLLLFCAMFICIINVLYILFADEFFRFRISFFIKDFEKAEPSGYEIMTRYISWTIMAIAEFGCIIVGLK